MHIRNTVENLISNYAMLRGYMGENYQDGKYALSVSLFVSFGGDLQSKGAILEPPVEKHIKESHAIALV